MTSTMMTITTMTTLTTLTTGLEVVAAQTRTTASTISISGEDQRAFAWRGAGDDYDNYENGEGQVIQNQDGDNDDCESDYYDDNDDQENDYYDDNDDLENDYYDDNDDCESGFGKDCDDNDDFSSFPAFLVCNAMIFFCDLQIIIHSIKGGLNPNYV